MSESAEQTATREMMLSPDDISSLIFGRQNLLKGLRSVLCHLVESEFEIWPNPSDPTCPYKWCFDIAFPDGKPISRDSLRVMIKKKRRRNCNIQDNLGSEKRRAPGF